ncbi:MAG: hypothetical protein J4400_03730 [Candidatus Aenigmarchaeota archaeon]|nr:hypothetical protein [Candidatus Aenigmarchaeota archaeon]
MVWRGVIIEESLNDKSILESVTEVGYSESFLEEEEEHAVHFHQFEISDDKKGWFIGEVEKHLKHGFYAHICKESTIVVVFKGKSFEFNSSEKEKLETARNYGLSVGVIRDQMPFEELIRDPFY